jgi:hypothetical protein
MADRKMAEISSDPGRYRPVDPVVAMPSMK